MKLGIIGLGGIAQKAYLPLYGSMQNQAEFILASRTPEKLRDLKQKYGFKQSVATVEELIQADIDACFVHTPTDTHYAIAKQLLNAGIHVFIDKPLSENLMETEELLKLAEEQHLILMAGFNRRFAPLTVRLKDVPAKNQIIVQKNRVAGQRTSRFVIYDLFIHALDTLLYLLDDEIRQVKTNIIETDGQLQRAIVHVETLTTTGIASMNLFAGANTETFEVMSRQGTYRVEDLATWTTLADGEKLTTGFSDWTPTLEKRGFQEMVHRFIRAVAGEDVDLKQDQVHLSHELCEQMLREHTRHLL